MPVRELINGGDPEKKDRRFHRDTFQSIVGRDRTVAPALYTQSSAPSSPNIVRSFRADSGIVRFSFSVSRDTHTKGYNIYRGGVDNSLVAERVDFVSQPGERRSENIITWDDPFPDNSKQYYYVAAVNDAGVEGARVGGRTDFLTASGTGNYIVIGAGTGDPSGTNDSSVAIATAEASMGTNGGVIMFLPGTYLIDTRLDLTKSNIVWEAYGVTFKYTAVSTSRLLNISGDNRTFRGATFSGNNGQPYGALIYVDDNTENLSFLSCTFRDISVTTHGVTMQNQVYASSISPYGCANFRFDDCYFYNLTSDNTANIPGWGFVGAVNFMKFTLGSPDVQHNLNTNQTIATSGSFTNCTFDTIKTILNTGLTDADVSNYDDADGIRLTGVGYDGTGVKKLNIRIDNCTFKNVSKRCVKSSGVDGITVSNLECIADQGAYSMNAILKLYGNSQVNGLKILCPGKSASLTRSGTTVTATVTAHGYSTGESICIIGADQNEYNGRYTITVTDANTFTYTIVGAPASPATGTIAATKSPRLAIQAETLQNSQISNVVMQAGGYFLDFNDTSSPAPSQTNVHVSNFTCDNLFNGGINTSTNNSTYANSLTLSNGFLGICSDIGEGIETPLSNSNTDGKFRCYNVEVHNGDVKIQGKDNIVDGLTIVVNRKGFQGTTISRSLLEAGVGGSSNYNIYRNIHVDVQSCPDDYLDADRTQLCLFNGDGLIVQNLSINTPTNINDTTYPHASFQGIEQDVDGLTYDGSGFISLGTSLGTAGSHFSKLSRKGYNQTANAEFVLIDEDSGPIYLNNISDVRNWTGAIVNVSGGTTTIIDGIATIGGVLQAATLTRAGAVATATVTGHGYSTGNLISIFGATQAEYNGVHTITVTGANTFTYTVTGTPATPATGTIKALKTTSPIIVPDQNVVVRNDFFLTHPIRKITTVTVAADNTVINTLMETVLLTAASGYVNCTLMAPTRDNLHLTILSSTGTSDIGVVAGTTAVFRNGAPTFGVGTGDVSAMTFEAIGGVWVELLRSEIGVTGSGLVSDTAYNSGTWDSVTTVAPSKNAVRDKIEAMISDTAYGPAWNGVTTVAPSQNAVYDIINSLLGSTAYTPSNVTVDRSYDCNATTVEELADVLATLISDLQTKGIVS